MKRLLLTTLTFSASITGAQVLPAAIDCQVDYQFVRAQVFENNVLVVTVVPRSKRVWIYLPLLRP